MIAVCEDWTVKLYRPFSFVKEGNNYDANTSCIHLPCLFPPENNYDPLDGFEDDGEIYDYHVQKAIITFDPLENPNECTVMVIFGEFCELAFLRLAKDRAWTKVDPKDYIFADDIFHYNNELWVLNYFGALISIGIIDSFISTIKIAPEIPNIEGNNIKRYIVNSCDGELFQVERYFHFDWSNDRSRKTKMFKVFRMDFDSRRWIEVNSLGDMALFLGDNSSISVLASDFIGCQPNCIYFSHDWDCIHVSANTMICDLGTYDVANGSFRLHYTIDPDALRKMSRRPPIWVVPLLNAH